MAASYWSIIRPIQGNYSIFLLETTFSLMYFIFSLFFLNLEPLSQAKILKQAKEPTHKTL